MTKFQVTLYFSFETHDNDYDEEYEMNNTSRRKQQEAFERTDKYYEEHSLMEHIMSYDAFGFVENLVCDGEVLSAEWDENSFAIHMVVETDQSEEELHDDLQDSSLEDGEYEACYENGWVLFTRGPNNEVFDGDEKNVWEYGLTDYRHNDIEIKKLS